MESPCGWSMYNPTEGNDWKLLNGLQYSIRNDKATTQEQEASSPATKVRTCLLQTSWWSLATKVQTFLIHTSQWSWGRQRRPSSRQQEILKSIPCFLCSIFCNRSNFLPTVALVSLPDDNNEQQQPINSSKAFRQHFGQATTKLLRSPAASDVSQPLDSNDGIWYSSSKLSTTVKQVARKGFGDLLCNDQG